MRVQICAIMSFCHCCVLGLASVYHSRMRALAKFPFIPVEEETPYLPSFTAPTFPFFVRSDTLIAERLKQVRPLNRLGTDGIIDGWIVMWHFFAYLLISFFLSFLFFFFRFNEFHSMRRCDHNVNLFDIGIKYFC